VGGRLGWRLGNGGWGGGWGMEAGVEAGGGREAGEWRLGWRLEEAGSLGQRVGNGGPTLLCSFFLLRSLPMAYQGQGIC
jgi:hypothetical protein